MGRFGDFGPEIDDDEVAVVAAAAEGDNVVGVAKDVGVADLPATKSRSLVGDERETTYFREDHKTASFPTWRHRKGLDREGRIERLVEKYRFIYPKFLLRTFMLTIQPY